MKTNTKNKLREMSLNQLNKRYNYLKSKQSPKANGNSNQMKYVQFHIKKITKGA